MCSLLSCYAICSCCWLVVIYNIFSRFAVMFWFYGLLLPGLTVREPKHVYSLIGMSVKAFICFAVALEILHRDVDSFLPFISDRKRT